MIKNFILSFFIVSILKIFSLITKLEIQNKDCLLKMMAKGQILFAFWHGRQFIPLNPHRNKNVALLISKSKDGDLSSNVMSRLGYKVFRGSSNRGGAKALVELIKALKEGYNIGFAVDGPRGPIYEAKPGLLFLAQKKQLPIILVASSAKKFWKLKAWDEFLIPKPFTKIFIRYSGPFIIKNDDNLEEKLKIFTKELKELQEALDRDVIL